jgi:hypothetical protein
MKKQLTNVILFSFIFLGFLFLFLVFAPTLFNSSVRSTNPCDPEYTDLPPDKLLKVTVDDLNPPVDGGITITVTGVGPKEGFYYTVDIIAGENTPMPGQVGSPTPFGRLPIAPGEVKTFEFKFEDLALPDLLQVPGNEFFVRAEKSDDRFDLIKQCGESPTFKLASSSLGGPEFVQPPSGANYNYGFKSLPKIEVTGLDPLRSYKFELSGKGDWKDFLREKDGDDIFPPNGEGVITVRDICENGEASRNDCKDKFEEGQYIIYLIDDDTSSRLTSTAFEVLGDEDIDSGTFRPFKFGDPGPAARAVVTTFFNFAIGVAGGVAFLLMIFGSYRLIFAGGNPESVQQGREVITAAIAGLIVIVFSVFILKFINVSIFGLL